MAITSFYKLHTFMVTYVVIVIKLAHASFTHLFLFCFCSCGSERGYPCGSTTQRSALSLDESTHLSSVFLFLKD
ncbi:hypothetical protein EDB92DRAFT_1532128 [Lactarius akahatsu]|uniref:Uncharacterized protein n=1 Tax=Lactarius akahatsu TaxID=416441 RepID=A0AAD4LQV5_9AGAM|nr:hypothetical protein EDB92DRAFT_1532128 [Lactarius akahatsu]